MATMLLCSAYAADEPATVNARVVILDPTNRSAILADDWLASAVVDSLSASLAQDDRIQILERSAIGETTKPSAETKSSNSTAVVSGWFTTDNGKLEIGLQVIDQRSNKVLWSQNLEGTNADFARLCRQASRAILSALLPADGKPATPIQEITAPFPISATVSYYRGRRAVSMGDYPRACGEFMRAIHKSPDFAEAWQQLSVTLDAMGRPAAAAAAFEQAIEIDPDAPGTAAALFSIASRAEQRGDSGTAKRIYNRIIKDYPFSRPLSPAGQAQVVGHQTGQRIPLPPTFAQMSQQRIDIMARAQQTKGIAQPDKGTK